MRYTLQCPYCLTIFVSDPNTPYPDSAFGTLVEERDRHVDVCRRGLGGGFY